MTDDIARHQALQEEKRRLEEQIKEIEKKDAFQQDTKCKQDILEMLEGHDRTPEDLPRLFPEIWPSGNSEAPKKKTSPSQKRPLIRYTHPETKKVVESRGLNQKTLQEWIKEHDLETVKDWGQVIEPGTADK